MNISKNLELGKYFTFEPSKDKPIYNWFYYKEAFSPEIIDYALNQEKLESGTLVDPFCGAGTSLLSAKSHGLQSIGVDASPLAVFVSKVKSDDYSDADLKECERFIENLSKLKEPSTVAAAPDCPSLRTMGALSRSTIASRKSIIDWQFELFSPRAAFPKSNLNSILSIREAIEAVEGTKASNLLMLALLSILPQCSIIIKDGGVLRIDKTKRAMPAKDALRRKVKRIAEEIRTNSISGPLPRAQVGDARALPIADSSADIIVTSPPYLNNIDYTKIYGLEMSLLFLDKGITSATRKESVRSFITQTSLEKEMPPEVGEIGIRIPIIGTYFTDMEKVLMEIKKVLKPNSACYFVVGNAVIHETHVIVDEVLAEMAERLGMQAEIVVGLERVADVKPRKVKTRESIIVMRK
ncbi:MAG: hypothetical protein Q7S22_01100 [Candidatus Micrarchaeota archaeon]|nr:hypothetical protein [Candidatus Micrarchaeota archaeon]